MSTIEADIETVLIDLEKYKESHPVFVKVWTLYLTEKRENLKKMISHCKSVLTTELDESPDLDPVILASLVSMF